MENHGITMKGKFFMEEANGPTAAASNEKRIVYNTSTNLNGGADQYGQYKLVFHNDGKWLRPLCANVNDGPDVDNTRQLGSGSYRFSAIYSADFYGQVRYS
jgi:hypothetical protein